MSLDNVERGGANHRKAGSGGPCAQISLADDDDWLLELTTDRKLRCENGVFYYCNEECGQCYITNGNVCSSLHYHILLAVAHGKSLVVAEKYWKTVYMRECTVRGEEKWVASSGAGGGLVGKRLYCS